MSEVVVDVQRLDGDPRAAGNVGTLTFDEHGVAFRPQHGDGVFDAWDDARVMFDPRGSRTSGGERAKGFVMAGLFSFLPGFQRPTYLLVVSAGDRDTKYEVVAKDVDHLLTARRIVSEVSAAAGRVAVGAQVVS